ncbi:hypothetical protein CKY39_07800 [Variovorax boronicumulans]|uniref:Uncharacterized protein n=1 Tax=Variovorax boronicumulans TaxID=436515 RepID=A0A250DFT2_9BURK|nr:metallophosphoesterase [Variovorax boronicumulans]ATA53124.1 hypothetical protein CKY39_07800 [Variovorax boronicumulans]
MNAVVLHLSDIHIRSKKDWIISRAQEIASCAFVSLPAASVVFIVVSGDVAWSGTTEQYDAAKVLFLEVQRYIQSEKDLPVHFIVAPGNHDCDFAQDSGARRLILDGVRNAPSRIDDSVIEIACAIQQPFEDFASALHTAGETRVGDQLWTCHRFTVGSHELVFDVLNVSWCSQIREEPGSLVFPYERYAKYQDQHVELRISVLHHPLNWFGQAVHRPFKQLLRTLSNIIFSGHEHVGGVGEDTGSDSGHSAYVEGCVLQDDKNLPSSSFNIVELNLDDGTYCSTRYLWNTADSRYSAAEEGSWEDFRTIPKKAGSRFPVSGDFHQLLSDPGAAFQSKFGTTIKLADLYVFPDMQELLENPQVKSIVSTSVLRDQKRLEDGVILFGEEKVGATSLLYRLFENYHDAGLLPLYIRGAEIKGTTDRDFDAAVRKAIIEQYSEDLLEKYNQTSSAKKVLLLDDFDDGPVRNGALRAKLLEAARNRFQHLVVTVSELFDFKTAVLPHAEGALAGFREFRVLPFGYTLRAKLIRRWFQRTASDGSLDEAELLARCDRAERMLDTVMARNIVPSLPLYLLTLLQSIDTGASGGFEESGLGEYYDFLIKEGLRSARIPKKDWGKVIEFCTHLAWQLHATENKEISIESLRQFARKYSEEQVRVELEERLNELLTARILSQSGNYFRFRYHYIYYFLKGRYLSGHLADLMVQAHVKEACAHLYVRENANTILFLAHHAFDNPLFLQCIVDALNAPFSELAPIEFRNGDTAKIGEFVRDLPALAYGGEQPEIVREQANHQRDEMDDGSDGLADCKQADAHEAFIPQMIALLKTVEILGQILKNQIATVGRAQRVELLEMLLKAPLRLVRAYFAQFLADKDEAQTELVEMLRTMNKDDDDGKRKKLAQRLLAQLMQISSFGFIAKTITSISSDELIEDIDSAAKKVGTPAVKLIAAGVRLDSPRSIPRPELRNLLTDIKDDFIAMRVLQMLTLRRLYMFRTSEPDKQWLASQSVLGLKMQHAVDMSTRGQKKLGH